MPRIPKIEKYRPYALILIISLVCLITIATIVYLVNSTSPPETNYRPAATSSTSSGANELIIGDKTTPITIYEYSDFKCPECGKWHQQSGKELLAEYIATGKAKIVFRPYPTFGADAGLALYGSYCAAEQNKFPDYYHALFAYMWDEHYHDGDYRAAADQIFTAEKLTEIAKKLSLETTRFSDCLNGTSHKDSYDEVMHATASDSVQGTPTIIIGNQKIVGNQPYSIYKSLLELETTK